MDTSSACTSRCRLSTREVSTTSLVAESVSVRRVTFHVYKGRAYHAMCMKPYDHTRLTASDVQRELAWGKCTSRHVTEACLKRVRERDNDVHAFVCLNQNALTEADAAGTGCQR